MKTNAIQYLDSVSRADSMSSIDFDYTSYLCVYANGPSDFNERYFSLIFIYDVYMYRVL